MALATAALASPALAQGAAAQALETLEAEKPGVKLALYRRRPAGGRSGPVLLLCHGSTFAALSSSISTPTATIR